MERFGIALKRARTARKLSQEELGELSGIGRTHVNRIETGAPMHCDALRTGTGKWYRGIGILPPACAADGQATTAASRDVVDRSSTRLGA